MCSGINFLELFLYVIIYIADNEKDMNYYDIPLPFDKNAEYNLNQIEGRHSSDDTVRIQQVKRDGEMLML